MNLNSDNNNISTPDYIPVSAADRTNNKNNTMNNSYYNRTKRKRENRASTYGLNQNHKNLIGQFGGCPWRRADRTYDLGVVG